MESPRLPPWLRIALTSLTVVDVRFTLPRTPSWAWCCAVVCSMACSSAVGDSDEQSPGEGSEPRADAPGQEPAPDADDMTPSTQAPSPSRADSSPSDNTNGDSDPSQASNPALSPSANISPRLTQTELNNSLRDLLGDGENPASVYLAEDEFSPYDNDATRQTVSTTLIDSMQVLADDVASRMAYDADARAAWMPCEPSGPRDEVCFEAIVLSLARSFFRRSVSTDEAAPYLALLDFAEERDDFYVAVELLLSSLIQDPEFLYRLERGTQTGQLLQLDDYEIATKLSFLLWGTTPDADLLQTAESGMLADTDGRRQTAARLLDHQRARDQLHRFHAMWLGYRAIPHDATLNAAFQLETETLIDRVVFDQPDNYLRLFQSDETYLTGSLAEHYGLPAPDGGEGWVTYPSDSGRAGILSHGSVLSTFSKFSDTSPTQRGIFVRTRLMCLDVPPPPATIDVDQPPGGQEAEGDCKLDRYRAHREQSGCAECHQLFDPIGEGLENFDMAGRYRSHDDGNEDCEINATGTLEGFGDFNGPRELAALLIDNDLIPGCFVQQYLKYSLAKGTLTPEETELATALTSDFEDTGFYLDEWLLEFVSQDRFAQRALDTLQENTP